MKKLHSVSIRRNNIIITHALGRDYFLIHNSAMRFIWFSPIAVSVLCLGAQAAIYDTLPKGVRTLVIKQVSTNNVTSNFTQGSSEEKLGAIVPLDARTLENAETFTKSYFEALKAASPEAYEEFSFGEFKIDGSARANVTGGGFGIGLTDRLTVYASASWYRAHVKMQVTQSAVNNHAAVQKAVNNSNADQWVKEVTNQLFDVNGELLQSVIVNYYNYKPIGDWEGAGLGDIDLGALYRLSDLPDRGLTMGLGITLPTGRVDDPDNLQDFAFGDGQTDIFIEAMAGITPWMGDYSFDTKFRYTYQFASTKTLRVSETREVPIGRRNGEFREKLGNIYELAGFATWHRLDWLSVSTGYQVSFTERASYESDYSGANEILAAGSEKIAHVARASLDFSTTKLYQKGTFAVPFDIGVSYQHRFMGKNTPKYDRIDLDLRFYF